ncbi:DUF4163 domain-containing protein [Sphingomonas sp. TX0543]|uniref:DUF4163 domain-containing protein n=1 Tax=unclassified Sphingomonas TaxID=196159 RepID=UPI0020168BC1|nr:DUF4163 domain-containing protein [Sphingomonas sp. 3P27F8]
MRILMSAAIVLTVATGAVAQQRAATQDYKFTYSYPAEAARIPALRGWLEADKAKLRASIATDAAEGRRAARKGGYPFNAYEAQKTWKVVTDTPRFLSLSGDVYSFTGGAHGNPGSLTLVWDKSAGRPLDPKAIFLSSAALQAAVSQPYCAKLDAERTARRGARPAGDDMFSQCPKVGDLTVLLGSSNRKRIDRIGLIADPYVAGPYAEGAYEVTLPVTPAVLRAVKPAYRAAFSIGR